MAEGFTEDWLATHNRRVGQKAAPAATIAPQRVNGTPATPSRRPKYGAVKTTVDGLVFDSKKEAARYSTLRLWQQVGAIRDLELQPRYELIASNGEIVGHFTPDFRYWSVELGRLVVEDVKGGPATKTTAYRLRKRLFTACHGITLTEV